MVTYRQNSHRAPSVGFPPCSDSGLRYKPSQTPVWKRSFGFSQSLGGGGRTPGEAQSPPRFCKVPVGIFLTPAFLRCRRSDKAVEKERQCPLNPAQLDLLSHSVLMPGKNVLTQQLSKQCEITAPERSGLGLLSPDSHERGSPRFPPRFPHLHAAGEALLGYTLRPPPRQHRPEVPGAPRGEVTLRNHPLGKADLALHEVLLLLHKPPFPLSVGGIPMIHLSLLPRSCFYSPCSDTAPQTSPVIRVQHLPKSAPAQLKSSALPDKGTSSSRRLSSLQEAREGMGIAGSGSPAP